MNKTKFGSLLLLLQCILLILFVTFVDYGDDFKPGRDGDRPNKDLDRKLPVFQDLHVMVFLGFGLIMTFLKRYSRGMLVHAFLVGGLVIQWATLLQGFFVMKNSKVELTVERMIGADLAVLVVLISIGALIGKVNPLQLLIIAMMETVFFAVNESVCNQFLKASDFGRSVVVHLFGALFGIAISRMIFNRKICTSQALSTSYKSEMYAMIGTLFLWIYFPSLNGAFVEDSARRRAIVNTYYALAASCITSFSLTVLQSRGHNSYNMNATITGGVAVGSVAGLLIKPWGAIILGILASLVSIVTYKLVMPKLRRSLRVHDVRGVFATHGVPALISGLAAVVSAFLANEQDYGSSLYKLYPARVPARNTTKYQDLIRIQPQLQPGQGRSSYVQGAYQLGAILVTVVLALVGGVLTGITIRVRFFELLTPQDAFDDHADFQEATCIDVCTDDEYDDDNERYHDSIHGNRRLNDINRHKATSSNNLIGGDRNDYGDETTSFNRSPGSNRSSYRTLSERSGNDHTSSHAAGSTTELSAKPSLENGIQIHQHQHENSSSSPLIVVEGEVSETST